MRLAICRNVIDTCQKESAVAKTLKHRNLLLPVLAITALLGTSVSAQKTARNQQPEQTAFSSDVIPGQVAIRKPVEISEDALQVLRNTRKVRLCIEAGQTTAEQVSASWFVGSEIHLNGPNEVDLIVQPRDLPEKPSENRCLYGAHVMPFWVLRHTAGKYELLLETYADVLLVLNSRTKGYRNIEGDTTTAQTIGSTTYRFDGEKYQPAERQDKPADAER